MKIGERKVLEVPKEFCSQAVIDWYKLGRGENHRSDFAKSDVREKARKHLSAVGWTFFYANKNGRFELRYSSPSGKCHYSLRTACKTCIDEGGAAAAAVSDRLVTEKVSSFSPESSPTTAPAGKSPTESSNSNSNSAASPPRKPGRKRGIDFESVTCQSVNDQQKIDVNCNLHVDLKDDIALMTESSNNTLNVELDDASQNSKSSRESSCISGTKRMRKQCFAGKERVRKVPHIRGFSSQSSRNNTRVSVLSLLIDNNVVALGTKVTYRGKQFSSGEITREGIRCHCCSVVFALTAFEDHVGSTNHRPAANILLEDGRSLMDCKRQMKGSGNGDVGGGSRMRKAVTNWNKGDLESEHCTDENDEICSFCRFGGELILCDRCPSAYHLNCLGYETAPDGDWFCPSCRCGVCGQGKLQEESSTSTISNGTVEHCVGKDDDLLICYQCERKFHMGCLRNSGLNPNLESGSYENTFCSSECGNMCLGLRNLVGKPVQVGADHSVTWTLLKSKENDPKLSAALSVMHQCFEPSKDPLTQRDIVEDVIFGRKSELSRLNFRGFYVVVLERDNELITVATVRICGSKLAEMPLVATAFEHRRLGMCHVLMEELEKQLVDLGVERLTLPAASGVLQTWVNSFGFSEMSVNNKLEFLSYNLLDFQGTFMCQKLLVGKTAIEAKISSPIMEDLPEDQDIHVNDYSIYEAGISAISGEHFEGLELGLSYNGTL